MILQVGCLSKCSGVKLNYWFVCTAGKWWNERRLKQDGRRVISARSTISIKVIISI
jgi:hypothetical protein